MKLPKRFTERMEQLLGEEYETFLACYQQEKKQGLRINTAKIPVEDFLKITSFSLTPIPWIGNGFFYREEDQVTKHPHYYAGLYYVQEPSAMTPASLLPVEPGDRLLDLCAAPGGKATELGARLKGTGMLVANDLSASRAGALVKNLELFGIRNAFVTAEDPKKLTEHFGSFFDKILVDAPCSGEGMFRKSPGLIKSWLERGPEYYAPVQRQILSCAVNMLRPGGMLLYSTCTFSTEEDEQVIAKILEAFPDLELIRPKNWYSGFSPGIALPENPGFPAENCVRIWPHRMEGEGHFAALLRKKTGGKGEEQAKKELMENARTEKACENSGLWETVERYGSELGISLQKQGRIFRKGDSLFLLPEETGIPAGIRCLRTGLFLGAEKKNRFEPSQALALALNMKDCGRTLNLSSRDPAAIKYLKGETLELSERACTSPGWRLVCCDGYPLGWGKAANGLLKNKYHPGWRMQ